MMTQRQELQLSMNLAIAIGYAPEDIKIERGKGGVRNIFVLNSLDTRGSPRPTWQRFSYRYASVALGVLKWLSLKHGVSMRMDSHGSWYGYGGARVVPFALRFFATDSYPTLEEAVARAAISIREMVDRNGEGNNENR